MSIWVFPSLTIALGFALAPRAFGQAPQSQVTPEGQTLFSQGYNRFGLGAMLGVPSGLSAKYRFSYRGAVDFGLAYSLFNSIEFYSDYLQHFPGLFDTGTEFSRAVTPYFGIGATLIGGTGGPGGWGGYYFNPSGSQVGLGIRVPFGAEWLPRQVPIGVFAELVPGVGVAPSTFAFVEADLGARYYF